MSLVVIDASAALSWVLPSQATAEADRFLLDHGDDTFVAPNVFHWEVANILLGRERRGRIDAETFEQAVGDFERLPIILSEPLSKTVVDNLRPLSRAFGISLFDAAYLHLAADFQCGLATRDGALAQAVIEVGLPCFDLRGVPIQ